MDDTFVQKHEFPVFVGSQSVDNLKYMNCWNPDPVKAPLISVPLRSSDALEAQNIFKAGVLLIYRRNESTFDMTYSPAITQVARSAIRGFSGGPGLVYACQGGIKDLKVILPEQGATDVFRNPFKNHILVSILTFLNNLFMVSCFIVLVCSWCWIRKPMWVKIGRQRNEQLSDRLYFNVVNELCVLCKCEHVLDAFGPEETSPHNDSFWVLTDVDELEPDEMPIESVPFVAEALEALEAPEAPDELPV
jgi:hypothetical protein